MLHYDPYDRELMKNPWPVYRRLRDEAPAYYMPKYDAWVLSRFADIQQAAMDREHYTAGAGIATGNLLQKRLVPDSSALMSMDPPQHTDYRKVLSPAFRQSLVQTRLPAFISERIAHYGLVLLARGEFDAVKELALPVATDVAAIWRASRWKTVRCWCDGSRCSSRTSTTCRRKATSPPPPPTPRLPAAA